MSSFPMRQITERQFTQFRGSEDPPFILNQEVNDEERMLHYPPRNGDKDRERIVSGFARRVFKEHKIKKSLGPNVKKIMERLTLFRGKVQFGDITIDEEGLLRLHSDLRDQQQNGSIIYKKSRNSSTLNILVNGDAHFDSVIMTKGQISIRRVHIEVDGILMVRKLEWILDAAMAGNIELIIHCEVLKMMGSLGMQSANAPRIRIHCEKNMICDVVPDCEWFCSNWLAANGWRKGGDIEITIGGKLDVKQPEPQGWIASMVSAIYRRITKSEDAVRSRQNCEEMNLDQQAKYLSIAVGYPIDGPLPFGYECGRIQINMATKDNKEWRCVNRFNGVHDQIYSMTISNVSWASTGTTSLRWTECVNSIRCSELWDVFYL